MGRWQPNAALRLQEAAMELFSEAGYETTTVEEIALRAHLTRRTFFRYFADKREVLFFGSEAFETAVIDRIRQTPEKDPLERVVKTLESVAGAFFDSRAAAVKRRRQIILSSPELQERESKKLGRVVEKATEVLVSEFIEEPIARFSVELGMLVFRRAFDQWADTEGTTLTATIRQMSELLRTVILAPLKTPAGSGGRPSE